MTSELDIYPDRKLASEESFRRLESFLRSEIKRIEDDPQVGLEYLYGTGMYDRQGHLKPEFA